MLSATSITFFNRDNRLLIFRRRSYVAAELQANTRSAVESLGTELEKTGLGRV